MTSPQPPKQAEHPRPDGFPLSDVEHPIPRRFEAWARHGPERVAVRARGKLYTYGEIDEWANAIAHAVLEQAGAAPEVTATLLGKDDPATIAAFLGVLKAGVTHVTLDASAAPERNRELLEDSGAHILLADEAHAAAGASLTGNGRRLMRVDGLAGRSAPPPACAIAPGAPALILYSSGSTGRPKGVLASHRAILHNARNMTHSLAVTPDDRIALLTTLGFMGGPRDALAALLNGASLSLYDLKLHGAGTLGNWVRSEAVTYLNMAVTVFRHFVAALSPHDRFPSVRIVKCGSEPLASGDLAAFDRHFGSHCRLWAGFGTTETGNVTQALIERDAPLSEGPILVGRALEGMELLILDENGYRLPAGEVGELAVRSRYLGDGYWKQPEPTARVFLPDPDGGDHRIYLTGDLADVRTDGVLQHHGRRDRMVKIRAAKVFLDEVELAMLAVDDVKQAAAVARADPSGNTRLVGYVSWLRAPVSGMRALREKLAAALPSAAVPTHFVELAALPSTAQGKLDRRALPDPDWRNAPREQARILPRTPLEAKIAGIWVEVLGLDTVGVGDVFLDLGGDSLQAGRIVARIGDACGARLPLHTLLQAATVEAMAISVTQALAAQVDPAILSEWLREIGG